MRIRHTRITAAAVGTASVLVLASGALAYWTTGGTGSATAAAPAVQDVTLTTGVPAGRLIPGGQADVAVALTNPNPFQVRVGALTLDTTRGTAGFAVDAGHSGCGLGALSFTAQSNGGDGWSVPPRVGAVDGALAVNLAGSVAMTPAAANACQGAAFTVHLTARADYVTTVLGTAGLVSYWRMGADPSAADNFTDPAGTALPAHGGTVATGWSLASGGNAVITDANRVRRSGTGYSLYRADVAPPAGDYAVQADIVAKSLLSGDGVAVVGRLNAAGDSGYEARYQVSDGTWRIVKVLHGVPTDLGSSAQALNLDQVYRVRLDLVGSALTLSVDGTVVVSATDGALTGPGRAGLRLGLAGISAATGDSAGLHADTFRLWPVTGTAAADLRGGNAGVLSGSSTVNTSGAIAGDVNGATTFAGTDGHLQVANPTGLPTGAASRSVELWFATTSGASQALFSYGTPAAGQAFGALLSSPANVRVWGAGVNRDFTLPGPVADGAWHHLVVTYDGSAERVYLDGAALAPQAAALNTTLDATGLGIGAVLPAGDPASGSHFAGSLDDVAVYNQVLPAATVADHYHLGAGA